MAKRNSKKQESNKTVTNTVFMEYLLNKPNRTQIRANHEMLAKVPYYNPITGETYTDHDLERDYGSVKSGKSFKQDDYTVPLPLPKPSIMMLIDHLRTYSSKVWGIVWQLDGLGRFGGVTCTHSSNGLWSELTEAQYGAYVRRVSKTKVSSLIHGKYGAYLSKVSLSLDLPLESWEEFGMAVTPASWSPEAIEAENLSSTDIYTIHSTYYWYKEMSSIWDGLVDSLYKLNNPRSSHPIGDYCRTFLTSPSPEVVVHCSKFGRDIEGLNATRIVPFKSDLEEKNLYDNRKEIANSLLAMYPEAERHTLLLALGRVIAGSKHDYAMGYGLKTQIPTTFRTLSTTIGPAGIGKSTLFDVLTASLAKYGYKVSALSPEIGRFSFTNEVMKADMVYVDDMTSTHLIKWCSQSSQKLKSFVTNGKLVYEEKYKTPVSINARGVIFANGNNFPTKAIREITSDGGFESRFALLRANDTNELGLGDCQAIWLHNQDKYNTTAEELGVVLLRYGYELYMEALGYVADEDGDYDLSKKPENKLAEVQRALAKEYYYAEFFKDKATSMLESVGRLTDLAFHSLPVEVKEKLNQREVKQLPFNATTLRFWFECSLSVFSRSKLDNYIFEDSGVDWLTCFEGVTRKLESGAFDIAINDLSPVKSFSVLTEQILTTDGSQVPLYPGFYSAPWGVRGVKNVPDDILEELKNSDDKHIVKAVKELQKRLYRAANMEAPR